MTFKQQVEEYCNENIFNTTIIVDCTTKQFVQMTIKVAKANYGHFLYYNIKCDEPLKNNQCEHPFFKLNPMAIDDDNSIGNVVADNELTRTMFKFLCMTDDELNQHTGNTHQIYYRAHIISCLSNLLD